MTWTIFAVRLSTLWFYSKNQFALSKITAFACESNVRCVDRALRVLCTSNYLTDRQGHSRDDSELSSLLCHSIRDEIRIQKSDKLVVNCRLIKLESNRIIVYLCAPANYRFVRRAFQASTVSHISLILGKKSDRVARISKHARFHPISYVKDLSISHFFSFYIFYSAYTYSQSG